MNNTVINSRVPVKGTFCDQKNFGTTKFCYDGISNFALFFQYLYKWKWFLP